MQNIRSAGEVQAKTSLGTGFQRTTAKEMARMAVVVPLVESI